MADSFTMRPRYLEVTMRIAGAIDLCAGVFLFFGGLAFMLVGDGQGVVAFVGSLIALWAGAGMTWTRVYVTSRHMAVISPSDWPPRYARRNDIGAIDICRHDFGKAWQIVPFARLRSGESFKLTPLSSSAAGRLPPKSREQRQELLDRQRELVDELRTLLGVSGSNYVEE